MLKFPKAYIEASATTTERRQKLEAKTTKLRGTSSPVVMLDDAGFVPHKTTARIDMSAEVAGAGLCPECRKPMEASHANDIPVLRCLDCRIAIPTPDAPEVVASNPTATGQTN
jgi:hypothetical protein